MQIHPKSIERFKDRVREVTARNRGVKAGVVLKELSSLMRGWGGYYGRLLSSVRTMKDLDSWCRRRMRQYLWVQWKTWRNRYRLLVKGGARAERARSACASRSPWRSSHHPAVQTCLSNALFKTAGMPCLADMVPR